MCVCVCVWGGGDDNTIYINTLAQCNNIIFVTVRMLCTSVHITRVGIGMQVPCGDMYFCVSERGGFKWVCVCT